MNNNKDILNVVAGVDRYSIFTGDSLEILKQIPDKSVDCIITSPPYWKQREYDVPENMNFIKIGQEDEYIEYIYNLKVIFEEAKRVLKDTGSLWLNLGDKYVNKNLIGLPWRVAITLIDNGWILRNDVIWDKMKGTQSSKDRLRDIHEYIFHFVKNKKYYYNDDEIRIKPEKNAEEKDGTMISATGVSGKKYFKQIKESTILTDEQKQNALNALNETILEMKNGEVVDFRMTINGNQRAFHSDSTKISGRAKELETKGYYILKMKAKGFLPSSIWRIVPEDKWRKDAHYAAFPEELLIIPIKATCPENGIVLDPFSGTGSTVVAALKHGKRGIGIDISEKYNNLALKRIREEF